MLIYEHSHTEEIIDRLIQLSNAASSMLIILCCLGGIAFFAALGAALGAAGGDSDGVLVGGIIGGVVGVIIGYQGAKFWSGIITGTVEWMAQSLIAQGETLEQLKKNSQ